MKLKDCRDAYEYYSKTASNIARQLGFAGIAIIWVFKTDVEGRYVVPDDLLLPGFLIVLGISFDFLHYVMGSVMWGSYHQYKEKKDTKEDEEFFGPHWMNWPANTLFAFKLASITLAYYFFLEFFIVKIAFK